ncbi:MAG: hypothetical protein ABMB14_13320 [Myxococcota bacterium]
MRVLALLAAGCPAPTIATIDPPDLTAPADPVTPPDPGTGAVDDCVRAPIGPAGGALEAPGVTIAIAAGSWSTLTGKDVTVALCPADAPDDARSAAWSLVLPPDVILGVPAVVTLATDADPALAAVYVPGPDGTSARALVSSFGPDGASAPVYRAGLVVVRDDDRQLVPFAPRPTTADLLLLIDNSCSMLDEQYALADRLPALLDVLDAVAVDYHVGVVSTDNEDPGQQGRLASNGDLRWVDPSTPSRDDQLAELVLLGNQGSTSEQGLATTVEALTIHSATWNAGFLRPDAALSVVAVSDEDDASAIEAFDVAALMVDTAYESDEAVAPYAAFHSLVNTAGAARGTKYIDVSAATGGYVADLGSADWARFLDAVGADLAGRALDPVPTDDHDARPELWLVWDDGAEPTRVPDDQLVWVPQRGLVYPRRALPDGATAWLLIAR